MTKEELKGSLPQQKLEKLQAAHESLHSLYKSLQDIVGITFDGPLPDAIWGMANIAVAATAENIGVQVEALEWFVYENEFGKRKHTCALPGQEPVVIDSIEAFLKFEGVENR